MRVRGVIMGGWDGLKEYSLVPKLFWEGETA